MRAWLSKMDSLYTFGLLSRLMVYVESISIKTGDTNNTFEVSIYKTKWEAKRATNIT